MGSLLLWSQRRAGTVNVGDPAEAFNACLGGSVWVPDDGVVGLGVCTVMGALAERTFLS